MTTYNINKILDLKLATVKRISELKPKVVGVTHTGLTPVSQSALSHESDILTACLVILAASKGRTHLSPHTRPDTTNRLSLIFNSNRFKGLEDEARNADP